MLEKYVHTAAVAEKATLLELFHIGSKYTTPPFASAKMEAVVRNWRLSVNSGVIPISVSTATAGMAGIPSKNETALTLYESTMPSPRQ